jgi:hypothetical protein
VFVSGVTESGIHYVIEKNEGESDEDALARMLPSIAKVAQSDGTPTAADLDAVSEEHKIAADTAATDGPTSPSADVAAKEEQAPGEEPAPPVQQ